MHKEAGNLAKIEIIKSNWGTKVAQLVERMILDFGLGH